MEISWNCSRFIERHFEKIKFWSSFGRVESSLDWLLNFVDEASHESLFVEDFSMFKLVIVREIF